MSSVRPGFRDPNPRWYLHGPMTNNAIRTLSLALILVSPAVEAAQTPGGSTMGENTAKPTISVTEWLVLGPGPVPLPVFAEEKPGAYGLKDLLDDVLLDVRALDPVAGKDGWRVAKTGSDGRVAIASGESRNVPEVVWLAARVRTDRFREMTLTVEGDHPRRAWLDGEPVAAGGIAKAEAGKEPEKVTAKIQIPTGTHLLVIRTVLDPARERERSVGAVLEAQDEKAGLDGLSTEVSPERDLTIHDILDPPQITSLAVSPDGTQVATTLSRILPGTDDSETWIELRSGSDGGLLQSWRGGFEMTGVGWSPVGRTLSYVTQDRKASKDGKSFSTLWLSNLETGEARPVVERIENFAGYVWSPRGDTIVFASTIKEEKDKRGVKLHRGVADRQEGWRDRQVLHLVRVSDGARRRLTAGMLPVGGPVFSPDGAKIAFLRQKEDLKERPYTVQELWELTLASGEAKKLLESGWLTGVAWSPDAKRLLVLGSPSTFGEAGKNVPEGVIPNEYDGQLYLWDPATNAVEAITREFDPAVTGGIWSRRDGNVYFRAADRDFERLYRYDVASRRIEMLEAGVDVLEDWAFAENAAVAAVTGTSPWQPETLRLVDLVSGESRLLAKPSGTWFDTVRTGGVEPFRFTTSNGREVDGRVYFPPGYDASKRSAYPAIVYYYGGTTPVERDFGGRYPKEWWAANGYVVYVLQPTGATGYGQEASAVHVNDWGEVTAAEILEGAERFLAAHPAVDGKRLGCIGASYGGFMTMTLVTKTDRFAAAVAHAGISQLASYWGEGYWGVPYSAGATADSFPWNRRDIYVDRSPLYHADKVKTPVLLTHGASDTNVPVGESDQFFAALRLVGAPSEFLEIEGQDHLILDHAKRIVWSRSIVAWFDRWLKERPEWWEALHPAP